MRLKKLTYRGVVNTAGTIEIDFTQLPPGIVALVGKNGSGKSTCMEAIPGALYRTLPSRSSLTGSCHGKDAFIELGYEFGGTDYRSLVKIDAERETQESYLYTGDGTSLVSGKVTEYNAMVADKIGSPSIFFASVFASQGKKGNFVGKTQAQRKELFIELLGLGHLQKISDKAKDRAKAIDQEVMIIRSKISDFETKLAGIPDLQASLATYQEDLAKKTSTLEGLNKDLQDRIQEEATIRARMETAAGITKQISDLRSEIQKIEAQDKDIEERLVNNRKILDQAEQIRGAAEVLESLKERLAEAEGELAKAEATRESLVNRKDESRALLDGAATCDRKLAELKLASQSGRSKELANKDAEVREAERDVSACRQTIATEETKLAGVKAEIKRMQEQSRILGAIPCGDSYPSCTLIASAITARDTIADKERQVGEWAESLELAGSTLFKDQGRLTALQGERETIASAPIEETPAEIAVRTKAEGYRKDAAEHTPSLDEEAANRGAISLAKATIDDHKTAIEKTRKTVDLLPKLEAAEKRIAELEAEAERNLAERGEKNGKIDLLKRDLANLPDKGALEAAIENRADADVSVQESERIILDIQGKVAAARARLEDLQKLTPLKNVQENILTEKLRHLSHWLHLQKAFGKDGIQALEIDSAGPGVSALVNDLLHVCYGSRFTFALRTTREGDKGQQIEDFGLQVTDNETGRVGDIGDLSGGEGVVMNESLGLGIAIFNTNKSGRKWETLWRDETAGALDPEAAMKYLQMLRRAIELGNFYQVVIIAHNQELWESCDARIHFAKGQIVEIDTGAFVPQLRALPQPKEQIAA